MIYEIEVSDSVHAALDAYRQRDAAILDGPPRHASVEAMLAAWLAQDGRFETVTRGMESTADRSARVRLTTTAESLKPKAKTR